MKNYIKLVLKFIKFFMFYMMVCIISGALYRKILYHIYFADYNVINDLYVFIPISFAVSMAQLIKKINQTKNE